MARAHRRRSGPRSRHNRQELGTSLEQLRVEVVRAHRLASQLRRHQPQLLIGAGVAGFVIGGGVAAIGALTFGRRAQEEPARPLTRALGRGRLGAAASWEARRRRAGLVRRGSRSPARSRRRPSARSRRSPCPVRPARSASAGAWMCCTIHASAPSCAAAAQQLDHPLERAPRGADPLDRGDLGLDGQDRLDLQRRAEPGLRARDPPAAAQVLEGVDREPHLQLLPALAGAGGHRGAVAPRRGRQPPRRAPPVPRRRRRSRNRPRGRGRPAPRAARGPARRSARCPTCRRRDGWRRSRRPRPAAARKPPGSPRSRAARWSAAQLGARAARSSRRSPRCRSRAGRPRASARTG